MEMIYFSINQVDVAMVVLPCVFPLKNMVGNSDVKLGEIGGVPFYMNEDQYEK